MVESFVPAKRESWSFDRALTTRAPPNELHIYMNIKSKRRAKLLNRMAKKENRDNYQSAASALLAQYGQRVKDGNRENSAFRFCGI